MPLYADNRSWKWICSHVIEANRECVCSKRVEMILKEDVDPLGSKGEIIQVKAGYGRNYLYPQRLAVYATDSNRQRYQMDLDEHQQMMKKQQMLRQKIKKKIEKTLVVLPCEVIQKDVQQPQLYGSVT